MTAITQDRSRPRAAARRAAPSAARDARAAGASR